MKKQYNEPQIYVENVVVENGIAISDGAYMQTSDWEEGTSNWFEE